MTKRAWRYVGFLTAAVTLGSFAAVTPTASATPGKGPETIAFSTDRNGQFLNYDVYAMRVGGSQETQLTPETTVELEPAWYPNGTRLAFVTDRDNPPFGDTEIYTMNPDGSNPQKLFADPSCYDFDPAYSPDGTKLAYSRQCGANDSVIYVKTATGTDLGDPITDGDATDYDELPTWSPDGSMIAYDGGDGPELPATDDQDIYVISSAGGTATDITNQHPTHEIAPDWNPKTNEILYYSDMEPIDDEIYKINSDGTGLVQLTHNEWGDFDPAWSPSGGEIAFASNPGLSQGDIYTDIYMMNQNGNGIRQLTDNPTDDLDPDWQPRRESTLA